MADLRFYDRADPIALGDLIAELGGTLASGADPAVPIVDVAPAEQVKAGELCFAATAKAVAALAERSFGAAITTQKLAGKFAGGHLVIHADPNLAFAKAATRLYPKAGRDVLSQAGAIHPTARIGSDVIIEHGAVIGPGAEIGAGSHIGPHGVIGRGVAIGRDCYIGPGASILYALVGDRVSIHGGARLGSDGFGYASGAHGHFKIPQLGRVIVQDNVEIGANTTIDRGALGDTVIGEGAKIDNLVQIGHNCVIGRNAILVSNVGLSGSVTVGDWAVLAGKVGVADHITIGAGARVAAKSGVTKDLPGGQDYGGIPAKPVGDWRREMIALRRLGKETRRRDE